MYVYIVPTNLAVWENTYKSLDVWTHEDFGTHSPCLIIVVFLSVCYVNQCSSTIFFLSLSGTGKLYVPLVSVLVSICWKNLLKTAFKYYNILLLATVLQSDFRLVDLVLSLMQSIYWFPVACVINILETAICHTG